MNNVPQYNLVAKTIALFSVVFIRPNPKLVTTEQSLTIVFNFLQNDAAYLCRLLCLSLIFGPLYVDKHEICVISL